MDLNIPESDIPFVVAKLIEAAKASVVDKKCPKCNEDLVIKALYENHPSIPSTLVAFCPSCRYSERVLWKDNEETKKYAELMNNFINHQLGEGDDKDKNLNNN